MSTLVGEDVGPKFRLAWEGVVVGASYKGAGEEGVGEAETCEHNSLVACSHRSRVVA